MAPGGELIPGVRPVDHTADVGIEVRAPSLEELFDRAAAGMMALLHEGLPGTPRGAGPAAGPVPLPGAMPGPAPPPGPSDPAGGGAGGEERELSLEADDVASLLALWLRELLYWHEVDGFDYGAAVFTTLVETRLTARVRGGPDTEPPVRELKGVTYHALEVACWHDEWHARVIFDV